MDQSLLNEAFKACALNSTFSPLKPEELFQKSLHASPRAQTELL